MLVGQKVPITGPSGFFDLIPPWPVGILIWQARVPGKLNDFWEAEAVSPDAVAAAPKPA